MGAMYECTLNIYTFEWIGRKLRLLETSHTSLDLASQMILESVRHIVSENKHICESKESNCLLGILLTEQNHPNNLENLRAALVNLLKEISDITLDD